ncbi:MAG TPA: hypothetical protein VII69_14285 [Candidatus Eremiobacteraceae bacterium]
MRITFMRPTLMTAAIVASAGILAGGLALRPAFAVVGSAMVSPFITCNKTKPCIKYNNGGTGAGLQGINTNSSFSGAGLLGTATVNGTGVLGQATAGNAVNGTSASGFGVFGESTSSIGVVGNSTSSAGVVGSSASSYGVSGATSSTSSYIAGVQGSNNATATAVRANGFGGLLFDGNNSGGADVFTVNDNGNTFVAGSEVVQGEQFVDALTVGNSTSAIGVFGGGANGVQGVGVGANPTGVFGVNFSTSGGTALEMQDASGTGVLVNGFDSGGNLKLQIQDDGSVFAHQFINFFDTPGGQRITSYATTSTTPNIEDFGEAQLTAGQAYVSLRPAYASAIDSRYSYMVFITPEGDTRGLYVTQKTPAGFVVRENQGGRSEAVFSYRVVAKPFGSAPAAMRPERAPSHQLPHPATLHHVPKSRIKGY